MASPRTTQPVAGDFKLLIHRSELDNLAGWVLEHPDDETGGDLFGFWTHSGSPTVQLVLGPAANARHEVAAFYQDRRYLEEVGQQLQGAHGLQHIGDWHSHHRLGLRTPSRGDANTARRVFEYTDFPRFMLLIATIEPADPGRSARSHMMQRFAGARWSVSVGAFLFERDRHGYRTGQWVVLPEASPLGRSMRDARVVGRPRSPSQEWQVPQTTLDKSMDAPRAPAAGWYTSEWGSAFLRTLDARCRSGFEDCRMALDPQAGELTYSFRAAETTMAVGFPSNYPRSPPVVTRELRGATQTREPPVASADADALFAWLSRAIEDTSEVNVVGQARDEIDGVEPEPDRPPRAGTGNPETLLPESGVVPPD